RFRRFLQGSGQLLGNFSTNSRYKFHQPTVTALTRSRAQPRGKSPKSQAVLRPSKRWHGECGEGPQFAREERSMRSIKGELESKRHALSSAIQETMGSTRDAEQRRDMSKDPYGSASLTHDDGIAVAMVDRRARELEEVDRALEDIEAGRY